MDYIQENGARVFCAVALLASVYFGLSALVSADTVRPYTLGGISGSGTRAMLERVMRPEGNVSSTIADSQSGGKTVEGTTSSAGPSAAPAESSGFGTANNGGAVGGNGGNGADGDRGGAIVSGGGSVAVTTSNIVNRTVVIVRIPH